jgi:hypothetical protein
MTTTKKTVKGTCGACFRKMALDANGRVLRHGWREVGGRRVGSYGNVYHSGPCFGVARLPFEVSPDCTIAFVAEVLLPMALATGTRIDALAANPPIKYTGCVTVGYGREEREWGAFEVRVQHGEGETRPLRWYGEALHEDSNARIPSYAALHKVAVRELTDKRDAIASDAMHCLRAIETWAPAAVATVEKKGALVHAHGSHPVLAACGRRLISLSGARIHVAKNVEAATCPKCLANLAKKSAATV